MFSRLWIEYRVAIITAIGGFLIGVAIGSWVQLKVKEAELYKLSEQSLKTQKALQDEADGARARMEELNKALEQTNEELRTTQTALATTSTELAAANSVMRQSADKLTGRLNSSTTNCVPGQSVSNIIGVLRRSLGENESTLEENRRCVTALTRCAKDAGQCGSDRAGLLEQAWGQYDLVRGANK